MGRSFDEDPFSLYLAPPKDETAEQQQERLKAEAEARRVSDKIDEQLKEERAALKNKHKKPVKVLLLGQSESGKSTTLKNFQLTYSPKAWTAERASWRTVIQLNIIRNVNIILDILAQEMAGAPSLDAADSDVSDDDDGSPPPRGSTASLRFSDRHALLKLRLAPLRRLQKDLEYAIGASSGEESFYPPTPTDSQPSSPLGRKARQEFFVRSVRAWKSEFDPDSPDLDAMRKHKDTYVRDATEIIAGCAEDMKAIWEDSTIQQMLEKHRVRLESGPGFFLNDVERIAARDYEPSNDDIVRARLRTLGVQEYKIKFENGPTQGSEWLIYDVGGSRTQRHKWIPFFDDCDAIIFLAPINCFDERLTEDRRVNRLEDSYMLWKAVCGSKLLQKTQMILFLNKCDLLEQKLRTGVRVKDHVRSFGDRSNDVETVSKYFAQHFKDILKRYSPEPRPFRVHMTSVIDTRATAVTLGIVEEGILRTSLQQVDLI